MRTLKEQLNSIESNVHILVEKRLQEFRSFPLKAKEDWFSELCFCILTSNAKAKTAINIQKKLGFNGFSSFPERELAETIKKNKHRFHNTKASYIIEARKHVDIKNKIKEITSKNNTLEAREWLVNNVKGFGYKEASHFLRNVGFEDLAILDRHILKTLFEHSIINEIPKPLNKYKYQQIEELFNKIAVLFDMTPAKLDLYLWFLKTGEVLK